MNESEIRKVFQEHGYVLQGVQIAGTTEEYHTKFAALTQKMMVDKEINNFAAGKMKKATFRPILGYQLETNHAVRNMQLLVFQDVDEDALLDILSEIVH